MKRIKLNWIFKQTAMICCLVVMFAAWNVPGMLNWQFWLGIVALATFDHIGKRWRE